MHQLRDLVSIRVSISQPPSASQVTTISLLKALDIFCLQLRSATPALLDLRKQHTGKTQEMKTPLNAPITRITVYAVGETWDALHTIMVRTTLRVEERMVKSVLLYRNPS